MTASPDDQKPLMLMQPAFVLVSLTAVVVYITKDIFFIQRPRLKQSRVLQLLIEGVCVCYQNKSEWAGLRRTPRPIEKLERRRNTADQ